jgi:hypothetical protein
MIRQIIYLSVTGSDVTGDGALKAVTPRSGKPALRAFAKEPLISVAWSSMTVFYPVPVSLIHHNGRTYPSAQGLRVSGTGVDVIHNTLHHTPYSAIGAHGSKLRMEHNRFHHVMEELSDGAAIYIFAAKSCILRGNYAYDLPDKLGHAYYLDEQSANSVVAGNVAVGVPWPIHNHMAWDCTLRDNVCINSGNMRITFPHCNRFILQRQGIIYSMGGGFLIVARPRLKVNPGRIITGSCDLILGRPTQGHHRDGDNGIRDP